MTNQISDIGRKQCGLLFKKMCVTNNDDNNNNNDDDDDDDAINQFGYS